MGNVKVNVFISHAPEDKPQLEVLLKWLYPMRDEVNLWYGQPPKAPDDLPLPWQILLFWYSPPDQRTKYEDVLKAQRERAHIYLFLTSYKSLSNKTVELDIDRAAHRRIMGDDFTGPFVLPIILSPCRWKETSRLAGYPAMLHGKPVNGYKVTDEAYLSITEEIASLVKLLGARLNEEKHFQKQASAALKAGRKTIPHLGEDAESLEFHEIAPFSPPEWLGWAILLFLFVSLINSLMPARVLPPSRRDIPNANDHGWEYRREHPLTPASDTMAFPPAD
ncbi:MAG: hypothetical protein JNJ57_08760 [Saprospiraceae bacterium]|nr:hypothetical protein [Saprospiraceae bacterium]